MDLQDVCNKFKTQDECLTMIERIRWPQYPICPKCNLSKYTPLKERHKYHCNLCNRTFTVTVDTIFHRTQIDLQKWFYAIIVTVNPFRKISARELAAQIGVSKDTAWNMQKKIKTNLVFSPELVMTIDSLFNSII
jgi:transposase-like protein